MKLNDLNTRKSMFQREICPPGAVPMCGPYPDKP